MPFNLTQSIQDLSEGKLKEFDVQRFMSDGSTLTYPDIADLLRAITTEYPNVIKSLSLRGIQLDETGYQQLLNLIRANDSLLVLDFENTGLDTTQSENIRNLCREKGFADNNLSFVKQNIRPVIGLRAPSVVNMQMWLQDPSVKEGGIIKVIIEDSINDGPSSQFIRVAARQPVQRKSNGHFIFSPDEEKDEADAVHVFAVVHKIRAMYLHVCNKQGLTWDGQWAIKNQPLIIKPHDHNVRDNAYYNRFANLCVLKFGVFTSNHREIRACRSFDIVAHETGHAILDSFRPHYLSQNNFMVNAFHEAFADLTVLFSILYEGNLNERIVGQALGNLQNDTDLTRIAEEFGNALDRNTECLRNLNNNYTMQSQLDNSHDFSLIFSGAIYKILVRFYDLRRSDARTNTESHANSLRKAAEKLLGLLVKAILEAPQDNISFDVISNLILNNATDTRQKEIIETELGNRGLFSAYPVRNTNTSNLDFGVRPGRFLIEANEHEIAPESEQTVAATQPQDESYNIIFGLSRETVYYYLRQLVRSVVNEIIKGLVNHLLTDAFLNYIGSSGFVLVQTVLGLNAREVCQSSSTIKYSDIASSDATEETRELCELYLDYDVRDRRVNKGWSDPSVYLALASLYNIELCLWQEQDGEVIPHRLYTSKQTITETGHRLKLNNQLPKIEICTRPLKRIDDIKKAAKKLKHSFFLFTDSDEKKYILRAGRPTKKCKGTPGLSFTQFVAVGANPDRLVEYCKETNDEHDDWREYYESSIIYQGPDARDKFLTMQLLGQTINSMDLKYVFWGFPNQKAPTATGQNCHTFAFLGLTLLNIKEIPAVYNELLDGLSGFGYTEILNEQWLLNQNFPQQAQNWLAARKADLTFVDDKPFISAITTLPDGGIVTASGHEMTLRNNKGTVIKTWSQTPMSTPTKGPALIGSLVAWEGKGGWWSSNPIYLASASAQGSVELWGINDNQSLRIILTQSQPVRLAIIPNSRLVIATQNQFLIWDISTVPSAKQLFSIPIYNFSLAGAVAYVGPFNNIQIPGILFSNELLAATARFPALPNTTCPGIPVFSLMANGLQVSILQSLNPAIAVTALVRLNENSIIAGYADGTLVKWTQAGIGMSAHARITTPENNAYFAGKAVNDLTLLSNGHLVVSYYGWQATRIGIWNLQTNTCIKVLNACETVKNQIYQVYISAFNDARFVSGCGNAIKVWGKSVPQNNNATLARGLQVNKSRESIHLLFSAGNRFTVMPEPPVKVSVRSHLKPEARSTKNIYLPRLNDINIVIERCLAEYALIDKSDIGIVTQLFDEYLVALLENYYPLHAAIMTYFWQNRWIFIKYYGHLEQISGKVTIPEMNKKPYGLDLEGFVTEYYLIIKARILLALLIKLSYRLLHSNVPATQQDEQKLNKLNEKIKFIQKELLVVVNALIIAMNMVQIFEEKPDIKKIEATHLSKIIVDYLLEDLANGIDLCISTGCNGHAAYLNLMSNTQDEFIIRLDNAGDGVQYHDHFTDGEKNHVVRSYIVGVFTRAEFIAQRNDIENYIAGVLLAKYLPSKEAFPLLYKKINKKIPHNQNKIFPPQIIQLVGNCVIYNFNIGFKYRAMTCEDIYKLLRSYERSFVTNATEGLQDHIEPALGVRPPKRNTSAQARALWQKTFEHLDLDDENLEQRIADGSAKLANNNKSLQHETPVDGLVALGKERLLSWSRGDTKIKIWDIHTGKFEIQTIIIAGQARPTYALEMLPESHKLVVAVGVRNMSGETTTSLIIWDVNENRCKDVMTENIPGLVKKLFVISGERILMTYQTEGRGSRHRIKLWDSGSKISIGDYQPQITAQIAIGPSVIFPDDKIFYSSSCGGPQIHLMDLSNPNRPQKMSYSASGFVVFDEKGLILIYSAYNVAMFNLSDFRNGKLINKFDKPDCAVLRNDGKQGVINACVKLSDEKFMIGSTMGTLEIWALEGEGHLVLKETKILTGEKPSVLSILVLEDGLVAIGTFDGMIHFWQYQPKAQLVIEPQTFDEERINQEFRKELQQLFSPLPQGKKEQDEYELESSTTLFDDNKVVGSVKVTGTSMSSSLRLSNTGLFLQPKEIEKYCLAQDIRGFREIVGDGNCFFRAVLAALGRDEEDHLILRQQAVAYIREHNDDFQAFFEEDESPETYCTRMSQDKEYAEYVVLQAVGKVLNCQIDVIDLIQTTNEIQLNLHDTVARVDHRERTICLIRVNNNHYHATVNHVDVEEQLASLSTIATPLPVQQTQPQRGGSGLFAQSGSQIQSLTSASSDTEQLPGGTSSSAASANPTQKRSPRKAEIFQPSQSATAGNLPPPPPPPQPGTKN